MTATVFPIWLRLREGLRWSGRMKVIGPEPAGYTVHWDAVEVQRDGSHRFIYDCCVMSAKQIKDWTGWEAPPP